MAERMVCSAHPCQMADLAQDLGNMWFDDEEISGNFTWSHRSGSPSDTYSLHAYARAVDVVDRVNTFKISDVSVA